MVTCLWLVPKNCAPSLGLFIFSEGGLLLKYILYVFVGWLSFPAVSLAVPKKSFSPLTKFSSNEKFPLVEFVWVSCDWPLNVILTVEPGSARPVKVILFLFVNSENVSNCGGAGGVVSFSCELTDLVFLRLATNVVNFPKIGTPKKKSTRPTIIVRITKRIAFLVLRLSSTDANLEYAILWSRWVESNHRPKLYESLALPTELHRHSQSELYT